MFLQQSRDGLGTTTTLQNLHLCAVDKNDITYFFIAHCNFSNRKKHDAGKSFSFLQEPCDKLSATATLPTGRLRDVDRNDITYLFIALVVKYYNSEAMT